jgi:hypothetical protein
MSKELTKEVRDGLRKAAEPVRDDAHARFSHVSPRSALGYKVRVRQRGVAVEQSRKRTTGKRPDFGVMQMREALLPALAAKSDEVVERLDDVLGRLAGENGFH